MSCPATSKTEIFLASRKPAWTINRMCLTCRPQTALSECILCFKGFYTTFMWGQPTYLTDFDRINISALPLRSFWWGVVLWRPASDPCSLCKLSLYLKVTWSEVSAILLVSLCCFESCLFINTLLNPRKAFLNWIKISQRSEEEMLTCVLRILCEYSLIWATN